MTVLGILGVSAVLCILRVLVLMVVLKLAFNIRASSSFTNILKVARATAKDLFVKPAQCFERKIIKKSLFPPCYKISLNPVLKMNCASNRTDLIWENLGISA